MDAFVDGRRQERLFRERRAWVEELRGREVVEKYRLNRESILRLEEMIREDIAPKTDRSHPLSSMMKVLLTLQFLAKGEFYSEGGLTHGVSKSSVCRSIWQVVDAIMARVDTIIFPTTDHQMNITKRGFFQIARVPNVLGAVDGTHIAIIAPKADEAVYVNRKGYHSINVQATVDHNLRFTDVVAQWPGSTHDSVIFNNCGLKEWLERRHSGWLLGDSGYALKPYLMTPKLNPGTQQEVAYNNAHSRTRMVVERAFGILKSRFRCLHKTGGILQVTPEKAAKLFIVCAKLHNFCLDNGQVIDFDLPDQDEIHEYIGNRQEPNDPNAAHIRGNLIAQF